VTAQFAYGVIAGAAGTVGLLAVGWLASIPLLRWRVRKPDAQRSWVPGPQRASVSGASHYTKLTNVRLKPMPEPRP
jgi:hypothetical protein